MEEYLLYTQGLSVGYDGKPVVREISLAVRSREILTLIGPNGAGKSTILRTLIGQLEATGGAVFLDGKSLARMDAGEIARTLSIVMTDRIDGELLTVEDVVRSGRYPYTGRLGVLSAHDRQKIQEAMEWTAVEELRDRYFSQLSDGQRQRVLLARAVCQEPKVLVMDEPTSFLDVHYQLELFDLLRKLVSRRGLAVILSLHELEFARRISDTVACIRGGAVDRTGPPEEILTAAYVEQLYDLPEGSYEKFFQRGNKRTKQTEPIKQKQQTRQIKQTKQKNESKHYSFMQNQDCEMFPCHRGVEPSEFNCLFCYCPLYALGERCGGNFRYTEKGIKDCTNCTFPHIREHYRAVLARFPELLEQMLRST